VGFPREIFIYQHTITLLDNQKGCLSFLLSGLLGLLPLTCVKITNELMRMRASKRPRTRINIRISQRRAVLNLNMNVNKNLKKILKMNLKNNLKKPQS
jgi:hypothetical protein